MLSSKKVLRVRNAIRDALKSVYLSRQEKIENSWLRDNGDKALRLNYDLNEKSIVFDLGGYEGQWTSDIFSMYCCTIHIFEPVTEYANNIKKRFSKNNKIFVHSFGLSGKKEKAKISVEKNKSSVYKKGGAVQEITLVKASEFLSRNNVSRIDLMKINIEGGEYNLLEHLIGSGYIKHIKNIQVQFHDFLPNAKQRMESIQKKLSETHFLTYSYPFVWENWKIKR